MAEAFIEEYHAMRLPFTWVAEHLDDENVEIMEMRSAAEDIREFVGRWKGNVGIPEMETGLENMERLTGGIESHLGKMRALQMIEVLDARRGWLVAEQFFKLSQGYIEVMKTAPPELKPTLEKAYREHMGVDYDAEQEFRESEAELDEAEERFRKAMEELAEGWPETATAEFRERVMGLEVKALDAWKGEVAVGAQIPTMVRGEKRE